MAVLQQEPQVAGTPADGAAPAVSPPEAPRVYGSSTGLLQPAQAPGTPAAPTGAVPAATPAERVIGRGGTALEGQALSDRLERERRKFMRDEYGTDDPAKVERIRRERAAAVEAGKKRDAEFQRLKTAEEQRQREAMSEQQRMSADLEQLKAENAALRAKIAEHETTRVSSEQETILRGIAGQHVDEDLLDDALLRFALHIRELKAKTPRALSKLNEKEIGRWFQGLVKERPKFAKQAGAAAGVQDRAPAATVPTPEPARPRRTVIRTAGKPAPARVDPTSRVSTPAGASSKTARPNQANTMSRSEVRQELKRRGLAGW